MARIAAAVEQCAYPRWTDDKIVASDDHVQIDAEQHHRRPQRVQGMIPRGGRPAGKRLGFAFGRDSDGSLQIKVQFEPLSR